MRNILAICLLLFSAMAFATNKPEECRGNCGHPDKGDTNVAYSQGQGQSQSADATAIAGAIAVSGSASSADNKNTNTNLNTDINTVGVDTSDYNANLNANHNTNVANGGRGGEGGNGYGGKGGEGGTAVQGQSQSSDNSNSSNNSSYQGISIYQPAAKTWRYSNNVSAIAPNIYSSSACTAGGITGAASALGVGVSLGGAKQDPQCQIRENARILAGLDSALAIEYLCKNPGVDIGSVLGASCKPPVVIVEEPEVAPPVVVPPIITTNQDVKGK